MGKAPLDDPRLSGIEAMLNAARFEEAQRLLAGLGEVPGTEAASVYFATRLLFQRGKLDGPGVVARLRELLQQVEDFPEAQRMLLAAERGDLDPSPEGFRRATLGPLASARYTARTAEHSGHRAIPRAPALPNFADGRPSEPAAARPAPTQAPPPLHVSSSVPAPVAAGSLRVDEASSSYPPFGSAASDTLRSPPPLAARNDSERATSSASLPDDTREAPGNSEARLLKAQAHARLGDAASAEAELGLLVRARQLEPRLRGAAARLFIELGDPERGLVQARQALDNNAADAANSVTCAWALVRVGRRTQELATLRQAEPLLASARPHEGALAPLLPALKAVLAAEYGDAARAIALAQQALALDARQADALAAIAVASARLGLRVDAERAWHRLHAVNAREAAPLEARLSELGVDVGSATPPRPAGDAQLLALWGPAETALVRGRRDVAIAEFERSCVQAHRSVSARTRDPWAGLAAAAARVFTQVGVLRHFAPYDSSVFSVERMAAGLDLLYGSSAHPGTSDAVVQLAGAYVGESLRQAFGGDWAGSLAQPATASVEAIGMSLRPCERVSLRLRQGEPLSIEPPNTRHPGADPLGNSVPLSLVPPCPWDPKPWPSSQELAELGRLLPQSIVGLFCVEQAGAPLDHSIASTVALDRYVALLAPANAPPDAEAGWIRRAGVLIGAYLGEVLADAVGAQWQPSAAEGAASFRLRLADGSITNPVTRAFDRLSGRRVAPLSEYVGRIVAGRPSLVP